MTSSLGPWNESEKAALKKLKQAALKRFVLRSLFNISVELELYKNTKTLQMNPERVVYWVFFL